MLSRRYLIRLAKALCFIVVFVALSSPAPGLALGVAGFDLRRPDAKNPDSAFHFNLEPGQSREDGIIVKNTTSDSVQDLFVYIADAVPTSNGGIALKGRQTDKQGLAKWIALDTTESISLAPGEERAIRFTLNVPMFSETKDERIAGIVIEQSKAVKSRQDGQFIINILPRAAILITQRLPGPAIRRLKITDFTQAWAPELGKEFKLAVKNTGNIHLRPTAEINIYYPFGLKAKSIEFHRPATIFPGSTSRLSAIWKNTPPIGYFTAEAIVRYEPDKSERRSFTFYIFPWWALPLITVGLWLIARRLRQRWMKRRLRKLDSQDQAAIAMHTLAKTVGTIEEKLPLAPVASAAIKTAPSAREVLLDNPGAVRTEDMPAPPDTVEPVKNSAKLASVKTGETAKKKPAASKTAKPKTAVNKKVTEVVNPASAEDKKAKKPKPVKKPVAEKKEPAKPKSAKKPVGENTKTAKPKAAKRPPADKS